MQTRAFGMKGFIGAIAIYATLAATPARADLIGFDDLPTDTYPIGNPYQGFNWENFGVVDGFSLGGGYANGVVSGPNVAYNGFGDAAAVFASATGTFTFNSGYFAGAWNDGLTIVAEGKNSGTTIFTKRFVVNTTGPSLIDFNWGGIDELAFTSFGGTNAGYGGSGTQFVLDDFRVNETIDTVVPEPGEFVVMGTLFGGLAVGIVRARRRP